MKPISDASSSSSLPRESWSCESFRSFIATSSNRQDLPSFMRSERFLQATLLLLKFHKAAPMYLKNTWRNDHERRKTCCASFTLRYEWQKSIQTLRNLRNHEEERGYVNPCQH